MATQEELRAKQAEREYNAAIERQKRMMAAESTPNPLLAARLQAAQNKMAAAQDRKGSFQAAYPTFNAPPEGMSMKMKLLLGGGVLAAGFFAWKKFRK